MIAESRWPVRHSPFNGGSEFNLRKCWAELSPLRRGIETHGLRLCSLFISVVHQ